MPDLSIFKLDSQTITIKDTTARQTAESAKALATAATTSGNAVHEQITELKSAFDVVASPNLFNSNAISDGYLRKNGSLSAAGDWATSDYIPVEYGKTYTYSVTSNGARVKETIFFRAEYDSNKNIISGTYVETGTQNYTPISESAAYLRFSIHLVATHTERCFVKGISIEYVAFGDDTYTLKMEANTEEVINAIGAIDIVKSRNLFDKNAIVPGYIQNASGGITVSGDWITTNYIPVEYGKTYKCSNDSANLGVYFALELDADKLPINYINTAANPYTPSTESVKYLRFSQHEPNVATMVFEEGTQATNLYTPFGYNLLAMFRTTLYGKKWVALGDSLTEKNVSAISNYTDFITAENNMRFVNMGVGGTGYMRGYDTNSAFFQRASNIPDCDIITVFGSGNDLAYYSQLGDISDTTESTICGCMNKTFDAIFTNHPVTPLLVIAPTPWAGNTPDMDSGMSVYCEKLQAICMKRGIAYLDLFHHSGLRPDDAGQRDLVFYNGSLDGHGDYVHPNKLGHSIIAPRIMQSMESVARFLI